MNNLPQDEEPVVDSEKLLNQLTDQFEQEWQQDSFPSIESFLKRCRPEDRHDLFCDLLGIELEYRQKKGETPSQEDYLQRLPEFDETIRAYFDESLETVARKSEPSGVSKGVESETSFGSYVLLTEISRGGMGVVYRAKQVNADRIVALKRILSGRFATEDDRQRFRNEARAAANLDHVNIVPIYDVGEVDGHDYFAMGFVDGPSLARKIQEGIPGKEAVVDLMIKIGTAVGYAHAQGVIHRDLKPGNIMLDSACQPFVTDFGLAKRVEHSEELTATGQILGTPAYMPPEQALGQKIDERADVYSLGAIMYHCLTGRPPFQSSDVLEVLNQVTRQDPVAPCVLSPNVDKDLETICLKCLEKDPALRFQTAQEFVDELERHQQGIPILSRPVGRMSHLWRWCNRNPVVASLSASLGIVILVGAIVSLYYANYASEKANESKGLVKDKGKLINEKGQLEKDLVNEQLNTDLSRYGLRIQESEFALNQGNNDRAEEILESTQNDLRGFEYQFLKSKLLSRVQVLKGHEERIGCVTYCKKINLIASGELTGTLYLWNAKTMELQKKIDTGHEKGILSVQFSEDGELAATSGVDRNVRLWNTNDWKLNKEIDLPGMSSSVRFVPGTDYLAVAGGDTAVRLFDVETGKEFKKFDDHTGQVKAIDVSDDGKLLVSAGSDAMIKLWEISSGKRLLNFKGHEREIWSVDLSSSGKHIVSGSVDNQAAIWDVERKDGVSFRHPSAVFAVLFKSDTEVFTAGYDGNIRVIDFIKEKIEEVKQGHSGVTFCLERIDDTGDLISGSWDKTLRVWSGQEKANKRKPVIHADQVNRIALSNNGKLYASSSADKTLAISELEGDHVAIGKGHEGIVNDVVFGFGDSLVFSASADRTIRSWNPSTGAQVDVVFQGTCGFSAIARWGSKLVSGDESGQIRIHNLEAKKVDLEWNAHDCHINELAVHPKRAWVASAPFSGPIRIWDLESGKSIAELAEHKSQILSVDFSSDGKHMVSAGKDRSVCIWDPQTFKITKKLEGHTDQVNSVRYFSNDQRIVTGSRDFTIKIWEPVTASCLLTIGESQRSIVDPDKEITKGHRGSVRTVAVTLDGGHVVSGGVDKRVLIWPDDG